MDKKSELIEKVENAVSMSAILSSRGRDTRKYDDECTKLYKECVDIGMEDAYRMGYKRACASFGY